MRPVSQNITATGPTPPIVVDYLANPTAISLSLNFTTSSGSGTVSVQYCFDDPYATYATDYGTNANWITHISMTNKTSDADAVIVSPVRAVRGNCSVFNSGVVKFTVLQSSES